MTLLLNVNATLLDASDFLGGNGQTPTQTPTPTPTPTPSANPIFNPPRQDVNKSLIAGSSGGEQAITPEQLSFVDDQQGPGGILYTITELPDPTTGQLFFKGVAVTQADFTFTQADINAGLVSFKATVGYKGPAGFGFKVSNGRNEFPGQRFGFTVEQNSFKFAGSTEAQVIVGSATLDNDIEGGDGDDDITAGTGKDKIIGGKGKDKIKGGDGDNDIDSGDDDDDIEVGKGKNKIKGGLGNDRIKGGDDDDTIEGGLGTNILTGNAGKDRFLYLISRQDVQTVAEADFITDFNPAEDVLEFSNAAFSLSASILTKLQITVNSAPGSLGSANFLDFTTDVTVNSIATLQARFAQLGGNPDVPIFCQFIDAATGRMVVVYGVGARLDIVASFSVDVRLDVTNFVFTGPPLNIPVGTADADNVDFTTSPAPVNYDGLAGDDKIVGSNYNDSLKGGDGNDTITGGLGVDAISGGTGSDLFVYRTTKEGGDKISDFTVGVDKFEFSASEFGNLTTTNFDGVTGSTPDITGKELVIFTGGSYASLEAAEATALGNSTTAGFFAFTNASNETVLYFDSNGTVAAGSTLIANLGTAATNLGTADFVFTGTIAPSASDTTTSSGSVADLTAAGNTFPTDFNNFGSGAGGYNFTTPVLFTGDATDNSVTGTEFADIFSGGSGADIFDGGLGNDSISGGLGNDSLFGGAGSDSLFGDDGNDTLTGGVAGTNVLNGGAGLDVFVFSGTTADGGDLITNYSIADDVINLDSTGFAAFTTGSGPLGSSFYAYSSTVSDVTVFEATLTGPSIMAIYDGLSTKLYYDSNGSTVGGNSLFATVDVNLGPTGNSELFLF
ncbi:Alkaline phosphatase [uncultured Microcoleus sp.]|uniref:Alkaline phosphatase n=1 Tax=uncultured Microcoleus sp. TaxID=259945 RepID=A0A6J4PW68_9CYAN|nr:Alkaline phosphatase [uncultured Microcoleus sp.]